MLQRNKSICFAVNGNISTAALQHEWSCAVRKGNRVSKSKTEEKNTQSTNVLFFGIDAFKGGFEKFGENFETAQSLSKDRLEAVMQSATIAGKGIGDLQQEIYSFSKKSLEESAAMTQAIFGAKSLGEIFALQSDFAKSNIAAYFGQIKKVNDLVANTAKESFAPLQAASFSTVPAAE
jgi:phasin family protein